MNKDYRFLLAAYFLSALGDWFYRLAMPLVIFEVTKSPLSMAIGYALTFLPFILASPLGGVIADRFERRNNLIIGDFFSFIAVLALALAAPYAGQFLWGFYLLIFIVACVPPFYHPSFQGFIPALVTDKQLPKANAFMNGSNNVIILLAPLIGGGTIAWLGAINTIYLNAASFLLSGLLILAVKKRSWPKSVVASSTSVLRDLKDGFIYAWNHKMLRYGALLFVGTNFATTLFYANFMYFLVDILSLSPMDIGLTFAIVGIGSVLGALIAPYFIGRFDSGRLIIVGTILAGLMIFSLLLFKDPMIIALAWAIVMGFAATNEITYFTLRQRIVPRELLGRAVAVTRLVAYSSIPIAAIFGGWLLEKTDIYTLILISAVVRVTVGCLAWFTPLNAGSKTMVLTSSKIIVTAPKTNKSD